MQNSIKNIEVVQIFNKYLPITENWCYRIIKNVPGINITIIASEFVNQEFFPLPDAKFIKKPFRRIREKISSSRFKFILPIFKIQSLCWLIILYFRLIRTELLHAHFSYVGWNYLWLSKYLKTPIVISFYGFDYEFLPYKEPVWKDRYKILFKKADLFITEGNFGRNTLIRMGCPKDKVKVVRLGVDVNKINFTLREKNENQLKLIQIATFVHKKGYDKTIKAFAKILKDCPGATLTLVGNDPKGIRNDYIQLINDYGLNEHINIIDGIDFTILHQFLNDFHVFIHPSKYSAEKDSEGGAPVVLLDAQATGMPVISTKHCDIPDEVIDGKTGILVEENDEEELANAIKKFYLMGKFEYQLYCRSARSHIDKFYDAIKNALILQDIYYNLTRGKRLPH